MNKGEIKKIVEHLLLQLPNGASVLNEIKMLKTEDFLIATNKVCIPGYNGDLRGCNHDIEGKYNVRCYKFIKLLNSECVSFYEKEDESQPSYILISGGGDGWLYLLEF